MTGINNILKPKSQDEVIKSALEIENADELLRLSIFKLGENSDLTKIALDRGANPNTIGDLSKVKNPQIIKMILEHPDTKLSMNSLVFQATKLNLENEIIKLIKDKKLDPTSKNSILFVWAVGMCDPKLVDFLLNVVKIDPTVDKESVTEALAVSIARGKMYEDKGMSDPNKVPRLLLKDKRIDPSLDSNRAIRIAAQFGNEEMFDLLMSDKRVDPSAEGVIDERPESNYALKQAFVNKHYTIVNKLLADKRVLKKLSKDELQRYTNIVKESLI